MNQYFGNGFGTLSGLTASEVEQLKNIGSSVISPVNWGFLSSLNQSVNTTSSPTFSKLKLADGIYLNTASQTITQKKKDEAGDMTLLTISNSGIGANTYTDLITGSHDKLRIKSATSSGIADFTIDSQITNIQSASLGGAKVAINTFTLPTEPLEVNGNIKTNASVIASAIPHSFKTLSDASTSYSFFSADGLTEYALIGRAGVVGAFFTNSTTRDLCIKSENALGSTTIKLGLGNGDSTLNVAHTKVGINQIATTEALEVNGNVKSSMMLTPIIKTTDSGSNSMGFLDSSGNNVLRIVPGVDCAFLQSPGAVGFKITEWSSITLAPLSCSKIGINQDAGTEALEITGNIKATGEIFSTGGAIDSRSDVSPYFALRSANGATEYALFARAKNAGNFFNGTVEDDIAIRCRKDTNSIFIGSGIANPAMCVGNTKVGINQAVGTETLEVSGNALVKGIVKIPGSTTVSLSGSTGDQTVFTFPAVSNTYIVMVSPTNNDDGWCSVSSLIVDKTNGIVGLNNLSSNNMTLKVKTGGGANNFILQADISSGGGTYTFNVSFISGRA
jgi:hypothetical protein